MYEATSIVNYVSRCLGALVPNRFFFHLKKNLASVSLYFDPTL